MKVIIDNIEKLNYNCISYPNKEVKKLEIDDLKFIFGRKDIKIKFDSEREAFNFISELLNENDNIIFEYNEALKEIINRE